MHSICSGIMLIMLHVGTLRYHNCVDGKHRGIIVSLPLFCALHRATMMVPITNINPNTTITGMILNIAFPNPPKGERPTLSSPLYF